MDIISYILVGLVSFGGGMATYRYMLKRDPATLEKWAAEAKRRGDSLRNRF